MASLDIDLKKRWKARLGSFDGPWIVFAMDSGTPETEKLNGMSGLIDWHLHGQVSSLLAKGLLSDEQFFLIPGTDGRPTSFLLYQFKERPDVKPLIARLRGLHVKELSLAESTFPEDFLAKLKQNLSKEGISCTKLEPEFS